MDLGFSFDVFSVLKQNLRVAEYFKRFIFINIAPISGKNLIS